MAILNLRCVYKMPKRFGGKRRSTRRAPRRKFGGRRIGRRRQPGKVAKHGLPKRQTLQSSLGGLTMTRFIAARRPTSQVMVLKKAGSPNYVNITYPGIVATPGGTQGYGAWYLNAGNDLRRIWASIQNQYILKNPNTSAEASSTAPALGTPPAIPVTNATFRVVLESAMSVLNLANTSGTPVNVELYDIVSKRDSAQLPLDISGNLAIGGGKFGQNTLILDPAVAWYYGMLNQTASNTGFQNDGAVYEKNDPTNLGATPYQSKLFKDYFKVTRKTNVSLPIGGQHKHCVDLKPNVLFDNDMLAQSNVFKGVTYFTLVVVSGIPVVKCPDTILTDPLRNANGDSTTSAVSVSVIQQVKYKYTWVEDTRENVIRANYINNKNLGAAQTTQPAMTKVTWADVPVQQVTSEGYFVCQPSECTR